MTNEQIIQKDFDKGSLYISIAFLLWFIGESGLSEP